MEDKKFIDKASILKDIDERNKIINQYFANGIIDRNDAISKILKLRATDKEVAIVTCAELSVHSTPFEHATNAQIIEELKMQVSILEAKLYK